MTYGVSLIHRAWELLRDDEVPFGLQFSSRFLFPLQGVFNVIVYTFPFAMRYRSENRCSWFHAICQVVKSGGDMDTNNNGLRL